MIASNTLAKPRPDALPLQRTTGSVACLVLALAAIGAGMIEIAIGAGGPAPISLIFIVLGVAHLGWALWLLIGDRIRMRNSALAASLVGVLVWPLLLTVSAGMPGLATFLRMLPLAAVAALNFFIALVLVLRQRRAGEQSRHAGGAGRYMAYLVIAATVLSAIVTPALAATRAGDLASPHGEHFILQVPAHEH